jgi:hypothetical protein
MFEEVGVLIHFIKLLDLPPAVIGALFGVGMYVRTKLMKREEVLKELREKAEEKRERVLRTETHRQLDFKYSEGYKGLEKRIHHLHKQGEKSVEVRHNGEVDFAPFKSYLDAYKDALKETAFKIVFPCILNKLIDDKHLYMIEDYHQYIVDSGGDIHKTFISVLGRKAGATDFSDYIEEDVLSEKSFIEMFEKIVRKAREL